MKNTDCFHIVDTVEETCHRDGSISSGDILLLEARLMVARGHRGTIGADTPSVDLPGGTQSIQRAVAVLRILAAARETGLGLTEILIHAGLTRPTPPAFLGLPGGEG